MSTAHETLLFDRVQHWKARATAAEAEIRSLREQVAQERAGIVAYLRREASLEAPFGLDPMSALGLPLDYAAAMIERHEDMKPTA
jgi:hypothetical protein